MISTATGGDFLADPPAAGGTAPHALAYHAGGLGDFVLSIPSLLRLAATTPPTAWHFWGPRDRLALLPGWRPAPTTLLRAEASLWGENQSPEAARWLGGAERVVAFATRAPPWLPPGPRGVHLQAFPEGPAPAVEWVPRFQARRLDLVGVPRPPGRLLDRWRRRVLTDRSGGWLVVHPGSGDRAKNLPLATWRNGAETLARETGLPILVLEGPVERERSPGAGGWPVERVACSCIAELLEVLSRAALLLGNDSGVAHLAGLLGVPTVAAFGPSDPARWRPLGPRVAVVPSPRECAPCCSAPPVGCEHRACLAELPAGAVVSAARKLLGIAPAREDQESAPARR